MYPPISKCNARGVAVANINVVNQLSKLTLMVDNFLQLLILVLIEDHLMLFMFYFEKRRTVACNMFAKLVDFKKLDLGALSLNKKPR